MNKFLQEQKYPIALLFVTLLVFITNYDVGTTLIGWDNLQTELNPWLAVKRAMLSGWQEYQSFGLASGMAHAADLVRVLFLLVLSLVLPASTIRFFFFMFLLFLGGLGAYQLFKTTLSNKSKSLLAFIGGLFYMLNFGTVQIFALPFEPFSIFFAFLPWEILVFHNLISSKKVTLREISLFVLVNLLATPQAYLQTIFIVYVLLLVLYGIGYLIREFNIGTVKRLSLAALLLILLNLFWILPQAYFIKTSLSVVKAAKINTLATKVVSSQNFDRGNIESYARLFGYYYDLENQDGSKIFEVWRNYHENPIVKVVLYIPFVLVLFGLFVKRKNYFSYFLVFLIFSSIFLRNTSGFSIIGSAFYSNSLLSQIFRAPFTKFIVPLSLFYTHFMLSGISKIAGVFDYVFKKRSRIITLVGFSLFMLIYTFPIFRGDFYAPLMQHKVPEYYDDVINYFNVAVDENARVGLLPEPTFWGWYLNDWGYQGSGFIWYGMRQPVISRTFDVWNLNSESYFWELKYAIESQNVELLEGVLNKYAVSYLLLDRALLPLNSVTESLQYDQVDKILGSTQKIYLDRKFGDIEVYKVNLNSDIVDFISVSGHLSSAAPAVKLTNDDQAFEDLGIYKDSQDPDYIYPFLDFTTQTNIEEKSWEITDRGDSFVLSTFVGNELEGYTLESDHSLLESTIFLGDDVEKIILNPSIEIEGDYLRVVIEKREVLSFIPSDAEVNNCSGEGTFDINRDGPLLSVKTGEKGVACFGYSSKLLAHWNSYLVEIDSEKTEGNNLFFYIFGNWTRKQAKTEVSLAGGTEYYILAPGYFLDDGYFFSFQNFSYAASSSENVLKKLQLHLFPYDFVKSIRYVKSEIRGEPLRANIVTAPQAEKINYHTYSLEGNYPSEVDVILYQSFDPGWKAYKVQKSDNAANLFPYILGEKVEEHFEVNNWANGWTIGGLTGDEKVIMFYVPQLLQDVGILVLLGTLTLVLSAVLHSAHLVKRSNAG